MWVLDVGGGLVLWRGLSVPVAGGWADLGGAACPVSPHVMSLRSAADGDRIFLPFVVTSVFWGLRISNLGLLLNSPSRRPSTCTPAADRTHERHQTVEHASSDATFLLLLLIPWLVRTVPVDGCDGCRKKIRHTRFAPPDPLARAHTYSTRNHSHTHMMHHSAPDSSA